MSKKHLVFIINPKSGVDREKAIQQANQLYIANPRRSLLANFLEMSASKATPALLMKALSFA